MAPCNADGCSIRYAVTHLDSDGPNAISFYRQDTVTGNSVISGNHLSKIAGGS